MLREPSGLIATQQRGARMLRDELERLTGELINRQDRLYYLEQLVQAMRHKVTVDEILAGLSREITHVATVQSVFTILKLPGEEILSSAYPKPMLPLELGKQWLQQVMQNPEEIIVEQPDEKLPPLVRNVLFIPVQLNNRVCGGLCLINKPVGFAPADLELGRAIARYAGYTLENALKTREHLGNAKAAAAVDLAAEVQKRLIPEKKPLVSRLDIAARLMPGTKSSGDFYDFVNAPNQRFVFALGDVARQGLEAVLLMTTLRTITHNAARFMTNANPRSVLLRANEDYIEDFSSGGRPATLFVAQFDPNRRELYYANAGHYPVIYCPLGGRARLLDADSPGLGANGKCTSENHVLRLEPGDLIVVASDGFVDAKSHNGEEFGLKRMLRLVEIVAEQSASEILTQMFDMLKDFCTGSRPEDDHSVLVVKGTAL